MARGRRVNRARLGAEPSPRETQVAIALLFGHSIAETAAELRISTDMVDYHRERLFAKFGAHSVGSFAAILTGTAERLPACLMPPSEAAE
jgi:DNA-binding CsgD family transcriptional regulator